MVNKIADSKLMKKIKELTDNSLFAVRKKYDITTALVRKDDKEHPLLTNVFKGEVEISAVKIILAAAASILFFAIVKIILKLFACIIFSRR